MRMRRKFRTLAVKSMAPKVVTGTESPRERYRTQTTCPEARKEEERVKRQKRECKLKKSWKCKYRGIRKKTQKLRLTYPETLY